MKFPSPPFSLLILITALSANAADRHVLPEGAGRMDGSSWDHAFGKGVLKDLTNELLQPGDRLLIGSGEYADVEMRITGSGAEGSPITITGVDRGAGLPQWVADWKITAPSKGPAAIVIGEGVKHVVVSQLRFKNYQIGVLATHRRNTAARRHLTFEKLDMQQMRHGFYLSDCDDLSLSDCTVKRYSKHAYRFDQGCDRVQVRRCIADCSEGDPRWEDQTESLPFGFTLNDAGAPNTAFVFEDCLAQNNLMPKQTAKYKNGDGFVVEGNAVDVKFLRCRALRNQDGGFDLKVTDVRLTGCVAIGNSRNYRIWTTATLTNCFSGWAKTGLWCNGGPVSVQHCTFHALKNSAILTDDKANAPVTLTHCLLSNVNEPHQQTAKGSTLIDASNVIDDAAKFVKPTETWNGLGDAMNSLSTPEKGYRQDR